MSSINPMQQQALAQMLSMPDASQAAPAALQPALAPGQAANAGLQPLIQALAQRRMQDLLAQQQPAAGSPAGTPPPPPQVMPGMSGGSAPLSFG